ncbi:MAG TPA: protein kinase [Kofleriaceae bacterium]|nr:protein kinase [Kofleriaceae bacterium]
MVADAAPVEQFGPYLVYERLGVGGMATVHRALERGADGTERIVALKRLLPHLAEDASFIKAFVREAKLASLLSHVNIVQLFELGRVGTEYFISMEYIDGRDVRRVLRHARRVTGAPPIHVTVGLLLQLCDALEYAHAKVDENGHPLGLVHRDVSPSNLLVTRAGILKVIDFGIAKAQSSQLRTQTGRVKGKLAYMAPEAVAGKDLDSRSDLFAAGVIAHELLTARPLFASKNEYQTLLKVQRGDIMPPSTFSRQCPPELDAIVLKALARDPNERYTNAAELREALLALRRKYGLATGHRDVAQWMEWASAIEPPSGDFPLVTLQEPPAADPARTVAARPRASAPAPRAHRDEEDAAIEHAWGGAEAEQEAGPVVLEDVPDVSDKHLGGSGSAPAVRDDFDDYLDDDIPAPQPSHGLAPRVRSRKTSGPPRELMAAPTRPTIAGHGPRARVPNQTPLRAVTSESVGAPVRRATVPPQPAQALGAHAPSDPGAPAFAPPPPQVPPEALTTMRELSMPSHARVRADSVAPRELPSLDLAVAEQPAAADELDGGYADGGVDVNADAGANDDDDDPDMLATARRPRRPGIRSAAAGASLDASSGAAASAVAGTAISASDGAAAETAAETAAEAAIGTTIGASIAARQPSRGRLLIVAGLFVAGTAAATVAIATSTTGGGKQKPSAEPAPAPAPPPPPAPARTIGTIKFVTVPEDAEITVEGHPVHQGSPWALELTAGVHQISIQRSGYKAWLTSLELSSSETQLLRVVLEPLGGTAAPAEATLTLATTPDGLEVVLDGQVLPQRTPLRMPIRPGRHVVAVRQGGAEVWRHAFDARGSVDYEFSPSMAEDKQRERAERASGDPAPAPAPGGTDSARPSIIGVDRGEQPRAPSTNGSGSGSGSEPADKAAARKIDSPSLPSIPAPPPAPAPAPEKAPAPAPEKTPAPAPAPEKTPAPAPTPKSAPSGAPMLVPQSWVTRIGGAAPTIKVSRPDELPTIVAAKLCIDTQGRVTSVDVPTKLERQTAAELKHALEGWTYQPYRHQGAVVPVCFVASLRTK